MREPEGATDGAVDVLSGRAPGLDLVDLVDLTEPAPDRAPGGVLGETAATLVPRSLVEEVLRRQAGRAPAAGAASTLTAVTWLLVGLWAGIATAVLTVALVDATDALGTRTVGFAGFVAGVVAAGWVVTSKIPVARGRGLALLAPLAAPVALGAAVRADAGRALSLLGHDNLYHFGAVRSFLVRGPVPDPVADVPAQLHRAIARGGSLISPCTVGSTRCQLVWYFHAEVWLSGLAVATVAALTYELVRELGDAGGARRQVRGRGLVLVALLTCATAGWFSWLWWLGSWTFLVALGLLAASLLVIGDARRTGTAPPVVASLLPAGVVFAWPLLVVVALPVALLLVARRRHRPWWVAALLLLPTLAAVPLSSGDGRASRGLSSLESPWASGLGSPEYRLLLLAVLAVAVPAGLARRGDDRLRRWWREAEAIVLLGGLAVAAGLGLEVVIELFGEHRGDYYGGKLGLVGFVLLVVAAVPPACTPARAGTLPLRHAVASGASRAVALGALALAVAWIAFPWGVPDYAQPLLGTGGGGIALAPALRPLVRALDRSARAPIDGPTVLAAYDTVRDCPGAGPERLPLAWDGAPRTDGTEQYAMYWLASLTGRPDWWEMSRRINVEYDEKELAEAAALHKVTIVAIDPARTAPATGEGGFVLAGPEEAYPRLCG